MPAATTHVLSALDILEKLPKEVKNKIQNINMFCIGAQGPDLFFFHNYGAKSLQKDLGNYMHNHKIFEVIEYMHKYVNSLFDTDLISYFYGYLCHYALDSVVHPIVYHRSRFGNLSNEKEIVIHFRIESFFDKYILEKKNLKFKTDKLVKISNKNAEKIGKMYQKLFKDLLKKDVKNDEISKTCKQVSQILYLLKPNSKLKFMIVDKLEELNKKPKMISSLMLYNDFKNRNYVLNNSKEEFFNINHSHIKYYNTFDELYSIGIEKGVKLILNPLDKSNYNLDFEGNPI